MSDSANEAAVWALWLAQRDHRTHELIELLDPEIVWVRPGPTEYRGHDQVRQMLEDLQKQTGGYRLRLDAVAETEPGVVVAKGRVFATGSDRSSEVTWNVKVRRGRITRVETALPHS